MKIGIIDNKQSGLVGDILKENIKKESKLSIAAAHFTLYAFAELKKELSKVSEFRFIFTEPFDVNNNLENGNTIYGVNEEHTYKLNLDQGYIAKRVAE